jgi:dihydroorotate dehydrogenase
VGVNIGKNRDVPIEDAIADYVSCLEVVHDVADYLVVNVSSPNTPNLRELQEPEQLRELVRKLQETNKRLGSKPLLVKIAPDLVLEQIESIVDIARQNEIAGVIATNTTISREGLQTKGFDEIGNGGLSGSPLRERSTQVIAAIYRYSNGKLPIIGVGGIFTAEDAFEKIVAGACLLQAYTGFIYCGPSFASGVNMGLAKILKQRGFTSVDEAVGCGEVLSSGRVLI